MNSEQMGRPCRRDCESVMGWMAVLCHRSTRARVSVRTDICSELLGSEDATLGEWVGMTGRTRMGVVVVVVAIY